MQCVEHVAAQRIAILRVQKPEFAPFLPSENRFSRPSRACVLVLAKIAVFTNICKCHRIFAWKNVVGCHLFVRKNANITYLFV